MQRQVDRMCRDLLKLAGEYAKLSEKLAHARHKAGEPLHDLEGEQHLLERVVESYRGPLPEHSVRGMFRELISGARSLVRPLRVAYLGPDFSYSHLAAIEKFGSSAELVPVATIAAVFGEINRKHVDFGIVPIENSTDGRVVDTLCMFTRLPIRICGEIQLRIHHYLLGKCPRAEIQEVYSKPQALSQCRDWLSKHLPLARLVEMTSTAAAAKLATDKPGAAAIASMQAGVNCGLDVIAEKIEDNPNNVTRFAVIGDHVGRRTGKDKTAVMFELAHTPGSLADATAIFKRNRLNLTWIESFPMPGMENEYLFFVEMEGHQNDTKVKRALDSLRRKTVHTEVLGSYARCEALD
jgi:chorismate mutase/prephenate dehydratase